MGAGWLRCEQAEALVNIYPVISGTFGAICMVAAGWVCDRIGSLVG